MLRIIRSLEVSRDQSNLRPMEGVRGFAVSLVFIVHYVPILIPWISKVNTHLLFFNGSVAHGWKHTY